MFRKRKATSPKHTTAPCAGGAALRKISQPQPFAETAPRVGCSESAHDPNPLMGYPEPWAPPPLEAPCGCASERADPRRWGDDGAQGYRRRGGSSARGGAAEDGAHHRGQQGAWPRSGTRARAPRPLRRRLRPLRRARPLP
jgi:hypothetical protein